MSSRRSPISAFEMHAEHIEAELEYDEVGVSMMREDAREAPVVHERDVEVHVEGDKCKPKCEPECCKPAQLPCDYFHYWAIALLAIIAIALVSYFGQRCHNYEKWNKQIKKCDWVAYGETMNLWWSIFIVVLAYSALRLYGKSCGQKRTINLVMYVVILVLAAIWSYTVFENGSQQAGLALAVFALILTVIWIWLSWKTDMVAAFLLILFVIWLLYVIAVNWNLMDDDDDHHHRPRMEN